MLINYVIRLANECRLNGADFRTGQNVLPAQLYINRSLLNCFHGNKKQAKVQFHQQPAIFVLLPPAHVTNLAGGSKSRIFYDKF
jgi:hypothetical protein